MADSLRLPRHRHRPERSREHPAPCPTAETGCLERFPASCRKSVAEAGEADSELQRLRRGNRDRDRASRRALPPADHAAGKADPDEISEAAPDKRGRETTHAGRSVDEWREAARPRRERGNPARASVWRQAGRRLRPAGSVGPDIVFSPMLQPFDLAPAFPAPRVPLFGPRLWPGACRSARPGREKAPPGPCGRARLRRCPSGRRRSSAAPSCSPRCRRCRDSAAYRSACAHRRCSSHSRRAEGCR